MDINTISRCFACEALTHTTLEYHVDDVHAATQLSNHLGKQWCKLSGSPLGPVSVKQTQFSIILQYNKLLVVITYSLGDPQYLDGLCGSSV